jgi:predicted MPP superfamily phosphohydrolase
MIALQCIQYISDIHLEFLHIEEVKSRIRKIIPIAPIIILAGDIGNPFGKNNHYELFIEEMSKKFEKVFLISGNHEYYHNDINNVEERIKLITSKYSNVSYLQNSYEDYNNIRWIGSTLWSHLESPTKFINDVSTIHNMTVDKYNTLHNTAVESIGEMIKGSELQCIVITHHMPSYQLIDKKYYDDNYNMWFACHLDYMMEEHQNKILGWFYGHTHTVNNTIINGVVTLCNPIGYKGENHNINYNMFINLKTCTGTQNI